MLHAYEVASKKNLLNSAAMLHTLWIAIAPKAHSNPATLNYVDVESEVA